MTDFFDFAMPDINKIQLRDRQKSASSPFPKKGYHGITKIYRGITYFYSCKGI